MVVREYFLKYVINKSADSLTYYIKHISLNAFTRIHTFVYNGNSLDRLRPDNDARVSRVRGDLLRHSIMVGADGITLKNYKYYFTFI
jgi:hypothetical protein